MDIAAWTERIKALRRELRYPEERTAAVMELMCDKLLEEAEEVADAAYQESMHISPERDTYWQQQLTAECGDLLVMLTAILAAYGLTLTDAMQAAEAKLTARVAAKRKES